MAQPMYPDETVFTVSPFVATFRVQGTSVSRTNHRAAALPCRKRPGPVPVGTPDYRMHPDIVGSSPVSAAMTEPIPCRLGSPRRSPATCRVSPLVLWLTDEGRGGNRITAA
jgi:hypothetical protein